MKTELGITALDKAAAKAFAAKVEAANKRAVAACDKAGLGFLLDPFACDYDPARDAAALCVGVSAGGVTGSNADTATCMSLKEAIALDKIWFGATPDGSYDAAQSPASRGGKELGKNQLWWTFTKGTAIGGQITSAGTDNVALGLQDVGYSADASATAAIPIANGSTNVRNKWLELDYAGLADAVAKNVALQPTLFSDLITDKADLEKLRDLGRKVVVWSGLADDAIPPAGNVNYHQRVVAAMGGHVEVQKFMRMYLVPGAAHSSQGRAFTVGGKNDAVPLPKLPGNANQTPTREQDQFFSALVDWVEKGTAPGDIVLTSRDKSVSYPVCVYPLRTTWNGRGPVTQATSFSCQ
jgi:feruloyl esterase